MRTLVVGVLAFLAGVVVVLPASPAHGPVCPDAELALEGLESVCVRLDALEARGAGETPARPAPAKSRPLPTIWWWSLAAAGLVGVLGIGVMLVGLPERAVALVHEIRNGPKGAEPKYLVSRRPEE